MSRVEVAGSRDEVIRLLLADDGFFSTSLAGRVKADMYSPAAFVGDANGLSGRLCSSKL